MVKLKLKKKNCLIALIILVLLLFEIFNPFRIIATNKLTNMNYSKDSAKLIIEYGLKSKVLNTQYSEFIDKNIVNKHFISDNYDIYKTIGFYSKSNDIELVNSLINKQYTGEEINGIMKTGTIDSIKTLLQKDKYENIMNYLSYDYAILSKLDEYIGYKELNVGTYEDAIIYINLGLDREYYTDYKEIKKFSYTMLVNKYNKLSSDFEPDDLITFPKTYCVSECEKGNRVMIEAFDKMASALNKETTLKIYARSAYRTYKEQESTYNSYLKNYGEKYALNNVAKPGFSEHQTGLSVDIRAGSSNTFKGTKESEWLKSNAYKYGFILRYDGKNQDITGFKSEEWHYRYVGIEVAKYIKENKITFDEYYVRFLENKE